MTAAPKRKPTLDDVAARAGVSRATVSRVLNGGIRSADSVRPEVREAIHEAARSLSYAPNRQAQAMAAGSPQTVAIMVTEIDDLGSAALVAGASRAARERGFSLAVGLAGLTEEDEIEAIRAIRGQRPRALIVGVSRTEDRKREQRFNQELEAFSAAGGRVSIIGQNSFSFDQVTLNNAESAGLLAEALVGRGYRRFAVVTGNPEHLTPSQRFHGFVSRLAGLGVEVNPDFIVTGDFDRNGGYSAAGELLHRISEIEVIFAGSDALALGVISRLRSEGIAVPTDVAVAGFDDVPIVRDLTPPLTTVRVNLELMAESALAQAVDESTATNERRTIEVVGQVMLRDSTPVLP